jgi:hypothetical protein
MVILMDKKADKNQINTILKTLENEHKLPVYIENENAISVLSILKSSDLSLNLLKNLPGINKIVEYGNGCLVN